jgi:hypothetical protein
VGERHPRPVSVEPPPRVVCLGGGLRRPAHIEGRGARTPHRPEMADGPDARAGVAGERGPPRHLAAAAAAGAAGRARRVRRAVRRPLQRRRPTRLVAEPGRRRRAPGTRLRATPGAPPSYKRSVGADAGEVAEFVLGWVFHGALHAVHATGV